MGIGSVGRRDVTQSLAYFPQKMMLKAQSPSEESSSGPL